MPESLSPERADYLRAGGRRKKLILSAQLLLLVFFFAQWELTARLGWTDAFIVSCPSRVWATLGALWRSGDLWRHVGVSCLETAVGFGLGTVLGTLVAVGLWWSPAAAKIFDPYLVVLNALPKTALGPIFIVWMGAGTGSIITMEIYFEIYKEFPRWFNYTQEMFSYAPSNESSGKEIKNVFWQYYDREIPVPALKALKEGVEDGSIRPDVNIYTVYQCLLNAYTGTSIYENVSFGVLPVDIIKFTGDLIANYIKSTK